MKVVLTKKEETQSKAKKILNSMGLSTQQGIDLFLKHVVIKNGLPFTPKQPTLKQIREHWDAQVAEAVKGKRTWGAPLKGL